MLDFERMLSELSLDAFSVPSQSTEGDRVSLLLVQRAVRQHFGDYTYLEIGSHLGGMLVPHLRDPKCKRIASVDKRPRVQPDIRGVDYVYEDNSTDRMIDGLRKVPFPLDLQKITTFDTDIRDIKTSQIGFSPDLVMIDGEHTTTAAISDFLNALRMAHENTVFLFHDSNITFDAILSIEHILDHLGKSYRTVFLDDNVGVTLLGDSMKLADALSGRTRNRVEFLASSKSYLKTLIATELQEAKPADPV